MSTPAEVAKRMRGLAKTIESLSEVPRDAAKTAAPKLTLLLQEQFERGIDPYGRPWAPLAKSTLKKGRHPPPLTDTGRLKGGTRAQPYPGQQAGIQLVAGADYGRFHQFGFRVFGQPVSAREIFPTRGLPFAWRITIKDAIRRAVKSKLTKSRG
jgi:Phage virion morphogenesis family